MSTSEDAFDDEALAAEYVLHLLEGDARQSFAERLVTDRDLQARVRDWEARLAALADDAPDVTPPPSVRARVLKAVESSDRRRSASALWAWLASGAVAAGVLVFVLFGSNFGRAPDLSPAFSAELAAEDRSVVLVAGVIPATHEIVIERIAGNPPEGFIFELWLIAEGADAPVSLGLLDNDGTTRIVVPDEIAPGVRTGTIAISQERPGGSPTGAPTGPIVATAQFSDI